MVNVSILFDKSKPLTYDRLVQIRSFIFSLLGLIATILALFISLYLKFYILALLVGGMIIALIFAIWLCFSGKQELFKLLVLFVINSLLLALSFGEGGESFVFVFYFPVIIIMPFILPDNKKYNLELFLYAVVTATYALISILMVPDSSVWEMVSYDGMQILKITNSLLSLLITLSITLGIIYSEKFFKDVLSQQKDKAEQSNFLKGRLLSGTSHELRTSLNGISGTTHLLETEEHLPHQEKHFNILKYCSSHMLNLVNEILDLDKVESGRLELHPRLFSLSKLLTDAQFPFVQKLIEKQLSFKTIIDPALENIYLYADDIRLLQVIHNLVSNAVKFTNEGSITLRAQQLAVNNNKRAIQFSVEDSGIGIEPEYKEKIFENFWQVYNEKTFSNRGTGLGLTLTKRILETMNSDIHVDSTPGEGSRFYFVLEAETAARPEVQAEIKKFSGLDLIKNKTVLIAEDDMVSMSIAEKILEKSDAHVLKAGNGAEVMQILESNSNIDLILLDLEMPVMNGYVAVVEIRKAYPSLPVIAFTAALIDAQAELSLRKIGFTACISKPFDINTFSEIFFQVLYDQKKG